MLQALAGDPRAHPERPAVGRRDERRRRAVPRALAGVPIQVIEVREEILAAARVRERVIPREDQKARQPRRAGRGIEQEDADGWLAPRVDGRVELRRQRAREAFPRGDRVASHRRTRELGAIAGGPVQLAPGKRSPKPGGGPRAHVEEPVERALDHVAGYTVGNDLSARDLTKRAQVPDSSPFKFDWLSQKCFDGSCPLGPWIVPAHQLPDPQKLALKLWVNDKLMQDSSTSRMIFDTAEQIAMLSARVTLQPGDLVLTGTPAGVGMPRRVFLKPGDVVKLWIEGIGELSHTMTA